MRMTCFLTIVLSGLFAATSMANDRMSATKADDRGFQQFLKSFEEATGRFMNGDPTAWKQHVHQGADASIMGGWGAYEKGWPQVSARYDWAASRFRPSGAKVKVEYLSRAVTGDLACTVAIERAEVLLIDQEKAAPMELRVTHVFRKEGGNWKLIHRHADHLMKKTDPGSVLR